MLRQHSFRTRSRHQQTESLFPFRNTLPPTAKTQSRREKHRHLHHSKPLPETSGSAKSTLRRILTLGILSQENLMSASKRARINRANAQNSTGPATPQGKLASSQNARTHGLTAAVFPDSLKQKTGGPDGPPGNDDFQLLLDLYVAEYDPGNQTEFDLVRTLASQQWQLRRADAYLETFSHNLHDKDPLLVSRVFENFTKQQARVQRAFNQTLTLLQSLQLVRRKLEQYRLNQATTVYKHLKTDNLTDQNKWNPSDDGFDFSLDEIRANSRHWFIEELAERRLGEHHYQ